MVHPLNAVFPSPAIYVAVLEMSPIVRLNSLTGTIPPKDLFFKAQDGVLSSGMRHRVGLQPFSGGFHHGQHIVGLRQHDVVNLPGLPVLIFGPPPRISEGLHLLGLLDGSTHLSHG